MVARTSWPPSSLTRNIVLGRASVTSPSTSIFSSLLAILAFSITFQTKIRPGAAESSWYQDRRPFREDPGPLGRDRHRVLEVRGERAVDGRDRPFVLVHVHLGRARRDHRLDRE